MQTKIRLFTLLLMISFASVNAVLFTPALPALADFFQITSNTAQLTITWFLIGYALGQLIYGPIANRFGRKPALYAGIMLQILSSLLCILAGLLNEFTIMVIARFMLALGSSVGLKMTFTLVHEYYETKKANQTISYLMLAFGITPGLGIALGGILVMHFGWMSCFYASALYGFILLLLTTQLTETKTDLDKNALQLNHLVRHYREQFKNPFILTGGLLMGTCTAFIYIFAAIGPFIAINLFGMNSAEYGSANILPPLGLIAGSLLATQLVKKHASEWVIRIGIAITCLGSITMFLITLSHLPVLYAIFLPMIIIYFGLALIVPNASTLAMNNTADKAHGASAMSFLNMGSATALVLGISLLPITKMLLASVYIMTCILLMGAYLGLKSYKYKRQLAN